MAKKTKTKSKLRMDVYDMWEKFTFGEFSEDTRRLVKTLFQDELDQALASYKECAKDDKTGKGEQLENAFCVGFAKGMWAVSKIVLGLPVHAWFEFDNKDGGVEK